MSNEQTQVSEDDFEIPTASYGEKAFDTVYLKADSVTSFCPVPPIGNQAKTGKTSIFYRTIYGFEGVAYKDPSKRERRFLISHKEKARNGSEAIDDPIETLIDERKAEAEAMTARIRDQGKAAGKTEEQINRAIAKNLAPLKEWNDRYRASGKSYMWVLQRNGRYGRLVLGWKVIQEYEKKAKALQGKLLASGVDPKKIGQYAGWYDVIREGNGFGTPDKVEYSLKPAAAGSLAQEPDVKIWTKAEYMQAAETLPSLESERDRDSHSLSAHAEIAEIMRANDFAIDPFEVDRILGVTERRAKSKGGAASQSESPPASAKEAPKAVEDDAEDDWAGEAKVSAIKVVAPSKATSTVDAPVSDDVADMFKD